MPEITAWKCSRTGKIFERKHNYIAHLKKGAREKLRTVKRERAKREARAALAELRQNVMTPEDLSRYIVEQSDLAYTAVTGDQPDENSFRFTRANIFGFAYFDQFPRDRVASANTWRQNTADIVSMFQSAELTQGWALQMRLSSTGIKRFSRDGYNVEPMTFLKALGIYTNHSPYSELSTCHAVIDDSMFPGPTVMARLEGRA